MLHRAFCVLGVLGACAASVAQRQGALAAPGPNRRLLFGNVPVPFSKCADEGGTCSCDGLVRYGAYPHWVYLPSSGDVACTNDVFTDPIFGTSKHCECKPDVWEECADEGGTCHCEGDVLFGGVEGFDLQRWSSRYSWGEIGCDLLHFPDPAPDLDKKCYCKASGWTRCADEGGTCQCASTLRFGAAGAYRYATTGGTVTTCHQSEFGDVDPIVGTRKHCDCYDGILELNKVYRKCADLGEFCDCPSGATVRFGAGLEYSDAVFPLSDRVRCERGNWDGFRSSKGQPDCTCIAEVAALNPERLPEGREDPD